MVLYFTQWSSDWKAHLEMESPESAPILAVGISKQTILAFFTKTLTNKIFGKGLPGLSDISKGIWVLRCGFMYLFSISAPI